MFLISSKFAPADLTIDNDLLVITTPNLSITFKGGDITKISNAITGEVYAVTTSRLTQLLTLDAPGGSKHNWITNGWRAARGRAANRDAAQIDFTDSVHQITMNVIADPKTGDITVTLSGANQKDGMTGLKWGMHNLDLSGGTLIAPVNGGREFSKTAPAESSFNYPTEWLAQFIVWQAEKGGFTIYSRDDEARPKRLHVMRRGSYLDVAFETFADPPHSTASQIRSMEWRINTFQGGWELPATGYRNVMNFFRKPALAAKERSWIAGVPGVLRAPYGKPELAWLDELKTSGVRPGTLLYVNDWRTDPPETMLPNLEWSEKLRDFIEKAHALGLKVMVSVPITRLSVAHPLSARLKSGVTDYAKGSALLLHGTNEKACMLMSPADRAWRTVVKGKLRPLMEVIEPDALYLTGIADVWLDGTTTKERKNFFEGCALLMKELIEAYPGLGIGCDLVNEVVKPYAWFTEYPKGATHPIVSTLFGDHLIWFK